VFGAYVHIPFCAHRCDYCAFATWTDRDQLMTRYVAACRREVAAAFAGAGGGVPEATSVFFGGGTPSRLPPSLLVSILSVLPRAGGAEVTVECNPENVTGALLAAYRGAGVNRLSFGVQSMAPHVLASLGRGHDPAAVHRAVSWARAEGFTSFNVDLIYGAAGETMEDWRRTLLDALALEPSHVSAYALTVERGTPLAADRRRWPDDDDQADKYARADALFEEAGLSWYEISNWARPGYECRHNQLYWAQGDYRGIGCAAHSHAGGRRYWNVRTPDRYIRLIEEGASPVGGEERLAPEARELEALQLALRTRGGVPAAALPAAADLDGLVSRVGDRVVLTVQGRLLANEVATRLVSPAPAA
jgi:putative oxygen-independent coproporphyrinogen III oxidase